MTIYDVRNHLAQKQVNLFKLGKLFSYLLMFEL